ncbi:MAG: DUF1761 domain-containing protein [Bacteroidales bacterium]|nr:DUF1761 domain-containing protein [Bacteroidales bacterium]
MFSTFSQISLSAVLAAFAVYSVFGALWFTLLFKKQYAISLGKEGALPEKPAPIFIFGPMVCSFFITVTSAMLMQALSIETYGKAFEFGAIVGLGYLVANTINIAINPNMPRPIYYGILVGAYHLVGILLVCGILVAMK